MKKQHLIATLVAAAALPLGIVRAEAPNTPEGTTGKQEQKSDQSGYQKRDVPSANTVGLERSGGRT